MDKVVVAAIRVAAICGYVLLCSLPVADAAGQEIDKKTISSGDADRAKPLPPVSGRDVDTEGLSDKVDSVLTLNNGITVPTQGPNGKAAKRSSSGGVVYGRGVYITADGNVRFSGKVIRKLKPGESLSMDELKELTPLRPVSRRRSERDARSTPSVGGSNSAGPSSDHPTIFPSGGTGAGSDGVTNTTGPASTPAGGGATGLPAEAGPTGSPAAATPGQSNSGEDVFVLGNGTQVPSDLGGGVVGTANDNGGVDYSDGRTAGVDPATGDTVFTNPDGSEATRYTPATEGTGTTPDGEATETFVMPNGNNVPREQGGGSGVPNDRGGVNYPDGSYTEYDSDKGETVFFDANGQEIDRAGAQQAYPSTDDEGGSIFVMTNGQTVPRTGPDGQVGTPNANGGVDYEGGVSTNPIDNDRSLVTGSPNGSYIAVERSTDESGNATFDLGNGTSVPAGGPSGAGEIVDGGAGVEYEDGTFISVDAKTGETVVQYPDGSSEVLEGQNNRKDAANYVYITSGESSNSGSDNDSGDKKDTDGNSNTSGGNDSGSDDDKDNKDQNGDDDDSEDSSDDTGDDGGTKDEGKESDDSEGADKNLGADADGGNDPESKKTVDDALARKRGDKKEPDSTTPPDCEDGAGGPPGGVAEPGAGQENCVPGGLQPGEDDEDDSEPAPILTTPFGNDVKRDDLKPEDWAGQPGIESDGVSNDGRTLEDKLEDIEGITNPAER